MASKLTSKEVDAYLQNHPEFVKEWFLKNVPSNELDRWREDDTDYLNSSRESTSGLLIRPSYQSNALTQNFKDIVAGRHRKVSPRPRKPKLELLAMNQMDLFMELIKDIANELDVDFLCHKILLNVSILTRSDRGSLFLTRGNKGNKFLVSKLFDVSEASQLENCLHTEDNHIRVPFGKGIAGAVAETKEAINIKNAYDDPRFNKEVDKQTGFTTKSLLCLPILNYEGDVVGVAQIMNKAGEEPWFSQQDEEVFRNYLTFCGIGLTNAQLFEMSVDEYKRNQMLLNLARGIFQEQQNLDNLVRRIMLEAQELLKCRRCSVYLIEEVLEGGRETYMKHLEAMINVRKENLPKLQFNTPEEVRFSKAFELHAEDEDASDSKIVNPSQNDLKESKFAKIAREVATSGEILNVSDSYSDSRFGDEIVDYDGFKATSLLSLPIRDGDQRVIGVVQLMNKCNGKPFCDTDVNIVEAFAIFCGLGIHNCQMYENACKLMAKQSVALEVLSYHATAPQEETEQLVKAEIPTIEHFKLRTYEFNDLVLSEDETCKATLRMFLDMGIANTFHVPHEVLCRWVLSVKKNYRPVTYHNWRHAFNVAQTMYVMLYTGNMNRLMSELEMFALVVACLCHDLDHRGTNNAFQSKVESPLAELYSTSTMEHHHFDQCIMILNSAGNNIFMNLSPSDYRDAIKVVENAILSTDLALYFKKKGDFQKLVEQGVSDWENPDNREVLKQPKGPKTSIQYWSDPYKKDMLRGMMMTACDVAAITKPWEIQREIAQLVAGEFFEQGDLERQKLHQEPIAMMDRRKKDELPKMQVGFIDSICLPVYQMFAKLENGLDPLLQGCIDNRNHWKDLGENPKRRKQELNIIKETTHL